MSPVVHHFQHLLSQLLQLCIEFAYPSIDSSEPGVWVVDNLQRPLPLQVLHCKTNRQARQHVPLSSSYQDLQQRQMSAAKLGRVFLPTGVLDSTAAAERSSCCASNSLKSAPPLACVLFCGFRLVLTSLAAELASLPVLALYAINRSCWPLANAFSRMVSL